jgi:hypothetical protein
MITFLGIIIFIIPFIFVNLFKDRMVGLLTIFTASFLIHLIVALVTQSLKIFNYSTIITIYILIDVIVLSLYYFKFKNKKVPAEGVIKKDKFNKALVYVAFIVVFTNLWSVHFNYSGVVNSYIGERRVEQSTYIYPYFSDEWAAISFVNYTIGSQSLPIVNPLNNTGEFKNPLVPYFSFLSDIFVFFGLDPLNDFALVTLLVGLTICLVFLILLSSLGVDKRVSAITILTIPYITNGGNLPGIWFLIPMIFSLIFYIISLIAFAKEDQKLLFLSSLMCLCLYPPFIAFVFPTLLALLFKKKDWSRKKIILIFASVLAAFIIAGLIVFNSLSPQYILETLRSYLFRYNLVGGILSFPIWIVLPVFVLPLALLGLYPAFKKKLYFLLLPLFVGLTYWFCYIDTEKVVIIDFPRVVVITSFLILIFFALSLNYILDKVTKGERRSKVFTVITIIYIFIAIGISSVYTQNESWRGLKLNLHRDRERMLPPAPTASRFLTQDDLKIFSGFTKKNFISPPWKGLVISAATGNYPLATKPSTIGVFTLNYNVFVLDSDCKEKQRIAIENKIDYVYSTEFKCPNFTTVATSSENLILYKFIDSGSL